MFCPSCGEELDSNNVCMNSGCPSNSAITSEFEKETSTNNDPTIENVENKETSSYNYNPNISENTDYNQSTDYTQNTDYNQSTDYTQNTDYNENPGYNQSPNYNQRPNYNENPIYNQGNSLTDKNGISANEMMDFFGPKNTEYYMDKWNRSQDNPSFISWNWPAFLFGLVWILFRKMYAVAGIVFVVSLISNIMLPDGMGSLVSLAIMIASGLFANQIYVKRSIDKIRTIKATTGINSEMLSQRLRAAGGITWVPVIIISVLFVLLVIFIIIAIIAFASSYSDYSDLIY